MTSSYLKLAIFNLEMSSVRWKQVKGICTHCQYAQKRWWKRLEIHFWKPAHSGEVIIAICAFLNAYFHLSVLIFFFSFRKGRKLDAMWKTLILFFWFLSFSCGRNSKAGFSALLCKFTTMQQANTRPVFRLDPSKPLNCHLNYAQCLWSHP